MTREPPVWAPTLALSLERVVKTADVYLRAHLLAALAVAPLGGIHPRGRH